MDHSDSPVCTVCRTAARSPLLTVGEPLSDPPPFVGVTFVGVSKEGAGALSVGRTIGCAAASTPWTRTGEATNNIAAALTMLLAADWGRRNPGSFGAGIPRRRAAISTRIDPVRNSQVPQATIWMMARTKVPSSGLNRADLIPAQDGR